MGDGEKAHSKGNLDRAQTMVFLALTTRRSPVLKGRRTLCREIFDILAISAVYLFLTSLTRDSYWYCICVLQFSGGNNYRFSSLLTPLANSMKTSSKSVCPRVTFLICAPPWESIATNGPNLLSPSSTMISQRPPEIP